MFRLEVSAAIVKVAKKKEKKKRKDRQLEADVLKAVLFSALPLPAATAADAIAHRASTAKNKDLYRKVIEEARSRGISVRKWPKKSLLRRMLPGGGGFAEGAQITTPKLDLTQPGAADVVRLTDPEQLTAGQMSGKRIMWPPSGESPGLAAHELGHAEQRAQSGMLQNLMLALGGAGSLGGIVGSARAGTPEEAQRAALIGTGISAIPGIASVGREAGAHIRGLRTLKRLGATRGQMLGTGLTEMAPAFLSSAARASVLPLATYLTARAVAPRRKKGRNRWEAVRKTREYKAITSKKEKK
jgi:hypothetical protein